MRIDKDNELVLQLVLILLLLEGTLGQVLCTCASGRVRSGIFMQWGWTRANPAPTGPPELASSE
jgi:hypothetical protein